MKYDEPMVYALLGYLAACLRESGPAAKDISVRQTRLTSVDGVGPPDRVSVEFSSGLRLAITVSVEYSGPPPTNWALTEEEAPYLDRS